MLKGGNFPINVKLYMVKCFCAFLHNEITSTPIYTNHNHTYLHIFTHLKYFVIYMVRHQLNFRRQSLKWGTLKKLSFVSVYICLPKWVGVNNDMSPQQRLGSAAHPHSLITLCCPCGNAQGPWRRLIWVFTGRHILSYPASCCCVGVLRPFDTC